MKNSVSRFEWRFLELELETTIGSATSEVLSGVGFDVGMIIDCVDFPQDTEILNVAGNILTLSNEALNTSASIAATAFERFDFTYPSVKQAEPVLKSNETVSESVAGKRQVQTNSIIEITDLNFTFLTTTQKNILKEKFYLSWAVYGKEFRYYEHKSEAEYVICSLNTFDFRPVRTIPKNNDFLYTVPFSFRRVL